MSNQALYLDEQLCFRLYACSRAMTKAYQPMLQALDITYPQYLVLMVLWQWHDQSEEDVSVKHLGERLRLDSGTLTPLLKRMEQAGLLQRQRDTADERRVMVRVAESGMALRQKALPWVTSAMSDMPMGSEQLQRLKSDLSHLLETLQS